MARDVYRDYLELCEFTPEEIDGGLYDEWLNCCKVYDLSEEDVRRAVDVNIPQWWTLRYHGIRKAIGAFTYEFMHQAHLQEYKEQGKPIVYGIMPVIVTAFQAIKEAGGDDVFVGFPDLLHMVMMRGVFGKGYDYFEAAEANGMTYGARHCALDKMRIGGNLIGTIPTPTVSWSWGLVCDEGCKTDEYIQNLNDPDWRYVITRTPHDEALGEGSAADDEFQVKYLAEKLREGMDEVSSIIGIDVTEEHLKRAIEKSMSYKMKLGQLFMVAGQANPPLLRGFELSQFAHPFSMPFDAGTERMEEAITVLLDELGRDVASGKEFEFKKDTPRVCTLFASFATPWLDKAFADNGIVVTSMIHGLATPKEMAPSLYTDPWEQVAEQWFRADFGHGCWVAQGEWKQKIEAVQPDAIILGYFDYDRWLGHYCKFMADWAAKTFDIPSFYMEADYYDDRDYSEESLRTRIETIAQMIKRDKKKRLKAAAKQAEEQAAEKAEDKAE